MSGSALQGVVLRRVVLAAVLIAGLAVYLFVTHSSPVLFRYVEVGNPLKEPVFIVLNPYRDRAPERVADLFLQQLKDGNCEKAMAALHDSFRFQHETCEREERYALGSWRLMNRTDEPQKVRMYFSVNRLNYDGMVGQAWVTVEKRGNQWQATRYDRYY